MSFRRRLVIQTLHQHEFARVTWIGVGIGCCATMLASSLGGTWWPDRAAKVGTGSGTSPPCCVMTAPLIACACMKSSDVAKQPTKAVVVLSIDTPFPP